MNLQQHCVPGSIKAPFVLTGGCLGDSFIVD